MWKMYATHMSYILWGYLYIVSSLQQTIFVRYLRVIVLGIQGKLNMLQCGIFRLGLRRRWHDLRPVGARLLFGLVTACCIQSPLCSERIDCHSITARIETVNDTCPSV